MAILDEQQNLLNENSVSMQPVIVKWGLISAIVSIIFQLISSLIGFGSMAFVLTLLNLGISIYLLIMAVRVDRDEQLGGYASFKRVFLLTFAIIMISTIITQVFSYVYMNFINPSAADAALESAKAIMEKFNMPEERMDKALEEASANIKSPMNIVKTSLWAAVIGAIIAAIYAAAMKKEKAMFE